MLLTTDATQTMKAFMRSQVEAILKRTRAQAREELQKEKQDEKAKPVPLNSLPHNPAQ